MKYTMCIFLLAACGVDDATIEGEAANATEQALYSTGTTSCSPEQQASGSCTLIDCQTAFAFFTCRECTNTRGADMIYCCAFNDRNCKVINRPGSSGPVIIGIR